jgi:hypothetical protein
MNIPIPDTERGRAKLIMTLPQMSKILVWGFAPFWIGKDQSALENLQVNPSAGFNLEIRGGIYIDSAANSPNGDRHTPIQLDWVGPLYVLNGGGAHDQIQNVVFIEANQC